MHLRHQLRELYELGARGTAFRMRWELETRAGLRARRPLHPPTIDSSWLRRLPFGDALSIADAVRDRIPAEALTALRTIAERALTGRIRCFGNGEEEFGSPIDWYINPQTRQRWGSCALWSQATADEERVGDVKWTWEIARFGHAYQVARAAAFFPSVAPELARAMTQQFASFSEAAPVRRGIHWASAQEVSLRSLAWVFCLDVLLQHSEERSAAARVVGENLTVAAMHTHDVIEYAKRAVYNNHLVAEALGIYAAGALLPTRRSQEQRLEGRTILADEADRQVYEDGGYILLSHNYERAVLQLYLWACQLARSAGDAPHPAWLRLLDRATHFLVSHQDSVTGMMPNTGPNDGSLPAILSTRDVLDFRPTLQAAAAMSRGERIYPPGPWDEEMAWWLGPASLDLPYRPITRRSVSFVNAGFHVVRAEDDSSTFATIRCGDIPDRFGQMDMLHVDFWWNGHNLLADPGTFTYSSPEVWAVHFDSTGSHNTIKVDGHDQMVRFRRFKHLYRTKARIMQSSTDQIFEGEHYAYMRTSKCIHRRSVRVSTDGHMTVNDWVIGEGTHDVKLNWQFGAFAWVQRKGAADVTLTTPAGPWRLVVTDANGDVMNGDVASGLSEPERRGWLSRKYGTKLAAPSLQVVVRGTSPIRLITRCAPVHGAQ